MSGYHAKYHILLKELTGNFVLLKFSAVSELFACGRDIFEMYTGVIHETF